MSSVANTEIILFLQNLNYQCKWQHCHNKNTRLCCNSNCFVIIADFLSVVGTHADVISTGDYYSESTKTCDLTFTLSVCYNNSQLSHLGYSAS